MTADADAGRPRAARSPVLDWATGLYVLSLFGYAAVCWVLGTAAPDRRPGWLAGLFFAGLVWAGLTLWHAWAGRLTAWAAAMDALGGAVTWWLGHLEGGHPVMRVVNWAVPAAVIVVLCLMPAARAGWARFLTRRG